MKGWNHRQHILSLTDPHCQCFCFHLWEPLCRVSSCRCDGCIEENGGESPLAVKAWLLRRSYFPLCYLISLKSPKCSRQSEHSSAKGMASMSSPCLHAQLHFKQTWRRTSYFHPTTFLCMWPFSSLLSYLLLFHLLPNESGLTVEGCIFHNSRSLRLVKFFFEHPSAAVDLPWDSGQ